MFKTIRNQKAVALKEIPELPFQQLRPEILALCGSGKRVVGFFGVKEENAIRVYTVLADDDEASILLASSVFDAGASYPCLTQEALQFAAFERELWEETGLIPEGHPWLKPVRYGHDRHDRAQTMESYPFYKMKGEQVHEVAVGPVHAGIIEPGHFRFMCAGEKIEHLEIQPGYQHRGVEALFLKAGKTYMPQLAESIAGDTTVGHSMAYCSLVESLSGTMVSRRANVIRAIGLELERAAVHTGDLAAISNDIAYLPGNSVFGDNRTTIINTSLLICGSRFGRGLIRPGGAAFDIGPDTAKQVVRNVDRAFSRIEEMCEKMFTSASVLSRLQHTGTVTHETAARAGLTGLAARASGVKIDVRADHPTGAYNNFTVRKQTMADGDVFARAYLRYMEIRQAVSLVKEMADNLPHGPLLEKTQQLLPSMMAVSMVEGWRGGIAHIGITGADGAMKRIKIKDPSFNNWIGLALAVRNNGISDFPLCNKSFDLSYCGNDL
ncbi:MAG: hydrogenase [Spirochaetia bacterium]|nr:hydrogenase [Spirochaetia bacterium]